MINSSWDGPFQLSLVCSILERLIEGEHVRDRKARLKHLRRDAITLIQQYPAAAFSPEINARAVVVFDALDEKIAEVFAPGYMAPVAAPAHNAELDRLAAIIRGKLDPFVKAPPPLQKETRT